mmetsp:Transcript_22590/g.72241  ORF Transcript_22590/g.72241 Transcript_22590/m.72241 type:complete len:453 (+) Transcript_22590:482-1840(+)
MRALAAHARRRPKAGAVRMPLVPRAHQGAALPRQGRLRRGLPGAAPRQDHRPQEDRLRLCQRREPGAAGGVLPAAPLPPRRRPLRGRLSPSARGGRRLRLRRDGVLRRRGPDRPHGVSPRRAAAARDTAGLLPVHAVPHPVLRALLRRAAPRPQVDKHLRDARRRHRQARRLRPRARRPLAPAAERLAAPPLALRHRPVHVARGRGAQAIRRRVRRVRPWLRATRDAAAVAAARAAARRDAARVDCGRARDGAAAPLVGHVRRALRTRMADARRVSKDAHRLAARCGRCRQVPRPPPPRRARNGGRGERVCGGDLACARRLRLEAGCLPARRRRAARRGEGREGGLHCRGGGRPIGSAHAHRQRAHSPLLYARRRGDDFDVVRRQRRTRKEAEARARAAPPPLALCRVSAGRGGTRWRSWKEAAWSAVRARVEITRDTSSGSMRYFLRGGLC